MLVLIRTTLLAVLAGVAFASDDQSLMQQGVGVEMSQRLSSAQSSMQKVSEVLASVDLGVVNRMALDAMMSIINTADPALTTSEKGVLAQAIAILKQIDTDWKDSRAEDDGEHQRLVGLTDDCQNPDFDNRDSREATTNESWENLTNCKIDENQFRQDAVSACDAMFTLMKQIPSACDVSAYKLNADKYSTTNKFNTEYHIINNDKFATMQTAMESVFTMFSNHWTLTHTEFTALNTSFANNQSCKSAVDDYRTAKTDCLSLQSDYEQDLCLEKTERTRVCTSITTCYDTANETLNNRTQVLRGTGATRLASAKVIIYAICVLENLENETIVDKEAGCDDKRNDPSLPGIYEIDYSRQPQDRVPCSDAMTPEPVTSLAFQNALHATQYTLLNGWTVHGPADRQTGNWPTC